MTESAAMEIIPVLDLKQGVVVHARMGRRHEYRPIETPLSPTSDPVDVARGLLGVHPFATLYVADLDAIARNGDNHAVVTRLRAAFPQLTLWVDNGICDCCSARDWLEAGWGQLVLGSETQHDPTVVRHLAGDARVALSLDFRGPSFKGPRALLNDAACWPQKVIAMTLTRVGSNAGPDLERLCAIRDAAPRRQVYAAGGVRDATDLVTLKRADIAGALVASSLHQGRLTGKDIDAL
jgi:phosphoribosylformimino-5-aminoimidazole carboxamide ribotide isomerase